MNNVSISFSFSNGFSLASKNYFTILLNTLIFAISCILASITIVGILILPALSGGFYFSLIQIAKGEDVGVGQIFKQGFTNFLPLLVTAILGGLAVIIGMILFLIPGIYLIIIWSFTIFLIVDFNIGAFESFSRSRMLVHSVGWWKTLLIFTLTSLFHYVFQLATLIPSIGNIVSILLPVFFSPFIVMVYIVYYLEVVNFHSKKENILS